MKKAIFYTVASIGLASGVTAVSVFIPSYISNAGNNPYLFDFNVENLRLNQTYLNSTNVGYKEALLGTKKINHGTYLILITSQAYVSNNKFLYGPETEINLGNRVPELNGDFGIGLKNISNLKQKPKILIIQDTLETIDYDDENNYNNMVNEFKKLDTSNGDTESDNYKKKQWAESAPSFSFAPGAEYTDWEGKTQKFRVQNHAASDFVKIVEFAKSRFKNLNDLSSSDGILIGYKNGDLCTDFSGSFTSGNEDGDSSSTETSSLNYYSSYALQFKSISANDKNIAFVKWLIDNYGEQF